MKAKLEQTDKGLGWHMICEECPLLPHLKALKKEARYCQGGIITNVQGPVPLTICEYYVKDSFQEDLTFKCNYKNTD